MPLARATAALLAALLLAGCGGAEPTARAHDGQLAIELDEFLISPQDVTAAPGRLTFRIANHGRLRHSFRLWGAGGEPVRVTTLYAGDEAVRTADLAPGEYRMVCTVFNHAELGMNGRLVVR
jgi:plastocyanin